jgi:hypothetical protein
MNLALLAILPLLWFLAAPAEAATRFANPTDSGNAPCTNSAAPCSLSEAVTAAVCGDTIQLDPGTYTGSEVIISGRPCTASSPMTVQAANFYVQCADPTNDPDGCVINTSNVSFINRRITLAGSHYWNFRGVGARVLLCKNSNNGSFRFGFGNGGLAPGRDATITLSSFCDDWQIEHSYFTQLATDGHDYGIRLYYTDDVKIHNVYFAGKYNHNISTKVGNTDLLMERIVCEGFWTECIFVGQEQDSTERAWRDESPTRCTGKTTNDGATNQTIYDHTASRITIRRMFARGITNPEFHSQVPLKINNARDVTVESVFLNSRDSGPNSSPLQIQNNGTGGFPGGRCGIERGNISIRGAVIVATGASHGCVLVQSLGESPATVTLDNLVCHGAASSGDPGILWGGTALNSAAWETRQRPQMTIRNSVWSGCTTAWSGSTGTIAPFTQSHNNVFNCGASKGGAGAQAVNPQFAGPLSVPLPTISVDYPGHGDAMWDWAGVYQPIINRFASAPGLFTDEGTGTAAPCTEANCDIGANEFFPSLP